MEYFFVNQEFINEFGACQKSKPVDRYGDNVYIVELTSWEDVKVWIDNEGGEKFVDKSGLFVWAIEGGIESENYSWKDIEIMGFFEWVSWEYNLGKECNQAQIINTVSRYEGCTPLELFNKLSTHKKQK